MSLKRFSGLALAVAAACALLPAAPAGALDNVKVSGTLQFTTPSDFHGRVNSKEPACKNGARVNLLRFDNAADTTGDKLGTDKASRNGAWQIMVPAALAGEYQILIGDRKLRGRDDFAVRCLKYLSIRMNF